MRLWHVVNLSNRTMSLAAEAFRYFILERANEIMNEMFPLFRYPPEEAVAPGPL
jgi:hypothetical protein